MKDDLKLIKKKYGENMSQLCRRLFTTLLEKPGLLYNLLIQNFEPSLFLYNDLAEDNIEDFRNYIYNLVPKKDKNIKSKLSPSQLFNVAGYDLYECKTEAEIQSFKKYYQKDEELCTFRNNRINNYHVFFAVKKNVDEIKREDFSHPKRQDLYGTSVISIQFEREDSHTLSIKNRYNNIVTNPDATFSNNLDNIATGLTYSFEKEYGLIQEYNNDEFEIPGYVRANDGKFYKYNYEISNIYYCPNNIIIDNFKVKKYEKEKYIIIDNYILDLQNKNINCYTKENLQDENFRKNNNELDNKTDSFVQSFKEIKKIEIIKENNNRLLVIYEINSVQPILIIINDKNQIIGFKNNNIKKVGDSFLYFNKTMEYLEMEQLKYIGNCFLFFNSSLKSLVLNNVKKVGRIFLSQNETLEYLEMRQLEYIEAYFCNTNTSLKQLILNNVKKVGDDFLYWNTTLEYLEMNQLKYVGHNFCYCNESLKQLILNNAMRVGKRFLYCNKTMEYLEMNSLKSYKLAYLEENRVCELLLENLECKKNKSYVKVKEMQRYA